MPRSLAPIPGGTPIVDPESGSILDFFRLRWQSLIDGFQFSSTVAGEPDLARTNQSAAIVTTTLFTTRAAGLYRVSYAMRRTVDDGVSSSLTVTLGWTQGGVPLIEVETPLTEAAGLSQQSVSKLVYADAATNLSIAVAYASNTPAKMHFDLHPAVEALA